MSKERWPQKQRVQVDKLAVEFLCLHYSPEQAQNLLQPHGPVGETGAPLEHRTALPLAVR